MVERVKNFIDGRWTETASGSYVANVNPANGEVIGETPLSTADEARAAVAAAVGAARAWAAVTPPVRGDIVSRAGRLLARDKQEMARLLTLEEGKTLPESLGEVQKAINVLEFMGAEGRRLGGQTLPSEFPRNFCYTIRQPLGPVGVITPWNFPVAIPAWKLSAALVCGNTLVFKPATITPLTAAKLVRIFEEAGLPKGVLNLVIGSGETVGGEIVGHKAVRGLSFTGSNEVGQDLYARGARRGIKVQCEMGGKNPVVVLEDAPMDLAFEGVVQGAFGSTGQRCTATSRLIIMDRVADSFVARLKERAESIRLGDGLDPAVQMGPSVTEERMKTVLAYIDIGKKEGAQLVAGGARATTGALAKGFFVRPTVFDHVKPSMRIFQEEIFGPVLSVTRVKSFDEAMEAANGVAYGLASSIYTDSAARAMEFIDRMEAGIVHVNSPTTGGEVQLPFGGIKATGVGYREMGREVIEFYTEVKTVYFDYTGKKRETNVY